MKIAQTAAILAHLRNGKSLTPITALRYFGCFRLSGRIFELKQAGHDIRSTLVTRGGKRVAMYSLAVK